mmetsp:Transcript_14127/g.23497  ORF Transcript_14127/g.23497 Transcript_14127/m.23497 type:complete len:119 (+) Transcript_14127:205-561(+)
MLLFEFMLPYLHTCKHKNCRSKDLYKLSGEMRAEMRVRAGGGSESGGGRRARPGGQAQITDVLVLFVFAIDVTKSHFFLDWEQYGGGFANKPMRQRKKSTASMHGCIAYRWEMPFRHF